MDGDVAPIHIPARNIDGGWSIDGLFDLATGIVLYVPVIFRASAIALLFLCGWGINIRVFERAHIPFRAVLGFQRDDAHASGVFGAARQLTLVLCACFLVHEAFVRRDNEVGMAAAQVTFWVVLVSLCTFSKQPAYVRLRSFLAARMRTFIAMREVHFVDVLMADVLTSMSKLLVDMRVVLCTFLGLFVSNVGGACMQGAVGPLLASLPFAVRSVQCIVAYRASDSKHNLVNLGKYLSAFPVIWVSALRHQSAPIEGIGLDQHDRTLQIAWLYAVTINSMYSFIWDVTMDWGLCRDSRSPHPLLRRELRFGAVWYYLAIVGDLGLRLCWSLKLSSHLQRHATGQAFVFLFEVLEVVRRISWIFLRVEWECLQKGVPMGGNISTSLGVAAAGAAHGGGGSGSSSSGSGGGRNGINININTGVKGDYFVYGDGAGGSAGSDAVSSVVTDAFASSGGGITGERDKTLTLSAPTLPGP